MFDDIIESEFSKEIFYLLENSSSYDVKINVGKESNDVKEFKAHSLILSARSKYFQKVLSKEWVNNIDGCKVLSIPNISPPVFEIILKYIYSGIIPIEEIKDKYLIDIMVAANELELHHLLKAIEEYVFKNKASLLMDEKLEINPFEIMDHCDQFSNLHEFISVLICRNPRKFFQSKEFLEIKENSLICLLKRDDLEMDEIEIWEHLIKWGITNQQLNEDSSTWTSDDFVTLEKSLRNFILLIRFFNIPYKEYHSKIRRPFKKIIPETLDDELLENYLNPNNIKDKLPPRISAFPFDSEIIDAKDVALITSWIDRKDNERSYIFNEVPYRFKLLLRGSRDGFNPKVFHKLCDNQGPTIIVAKVRNTNEIIGGYNPLEWKSQKLKDIKFKKFPVRTRNSFIFSLTDRTNPILSRVLPNNINKAIILDDQNGALFGESDLWMSQLGQSGQFTVVTCKQNSYERNIIEKEYFEIDQYEVFQAYKEVTLITPIIRIVIIFIIYKILMFFM